MVYESVSFTSQVVAQNSKLKAELMKTKERIALEDIARLYNCRDVDDLSDDDAQIVMYLTELGMIDMDKVYTEDGDYMYSELFVTIDD